MATLRIAFAALMGLMSLSASAAELASEWQAPPSTMEFKDFLVVPLRIHLLSSSNEILNTTLEAKDFERIVPKMNRIWAQAGVHFYIDALTRREAANQGSAALVARDMTKLLMVCPEDSRSTNAFDLYYVKRFRSNGIYLHDQPPGKQNLFNVFGTITDEKGIDAFEEVLSQVPQVRSAMFIKDTSSLKPIDGGIDEPLPRVSSHELGHALGLSHRQNVTNLMSSGTTGVWLNPVEISIARTVAKRFPWIRSAPEILKEADALYDAKKRDEARKLYQKISAIPRDLPEVNKAKKRLAAKSE